MAKQETIDIIKNMSTYELSRWCAMLEAVELIAAKCIDRGMDPDANHEAFERFLKPHHIQHYIDKRADRLVEEAEYEAAKIADRAFQKASFIAEQEQRKKTNK